MSPFGSSKISRGDARRAALVKSAQVWSSNPAMLGSSQYNSYAQSKADPSTADAMVRNAASSSGFGWSNDDWRNYAKMWATAAPAAASIALAPAAGAAVFPAAWSALGGYTAADGAFKTYDSLAAGDMRGAASNAALTGLGVALPFAKARKGLNFLRPAMLRLASRLGLGRVGTAAMAAAPTVTATAAGTLPVADKVFGLTQHDPSDTGVSAKFKDAFREYFPFAKLLSPGSIPLVNAFNNSPIPDYAVEKAVSSARDKVLARYSADPGAIVPDLDNLRAWLNEPSDLNYAVLSEYAPSLANLAGIISRASGHTPSAQPVFSGVAGDRVMSAAKRGFLSESGPYAGKIAWARKLYEDANGIMHSPNASRLNGAASLVPLVVAPIAAASAMSGGSGGM